MVRLLAGGLALVLFAASPARADSVERNLETVRAMVDAVNRRDFDALDGLVASDVLRHCAATPDVEVTDLAGFKAFLRADGAGVPDSVQEIQEIFGQGDLVAVRVAYRGTQTGPMGPFPPSGRKVDLPFLAILRLDKGKIAEIWVEWDNLVILGQIGAWPPPAVAAEEANKALARRWFDDVINRRDLDAISEIYSADYVHHGQGDLQLRGLEQVRGFAAGILAASSDRHAEVERQVVEGERVVTQFTSRGTQTGAYRGIPPSGKEWVVEGIVISRIEDGKIVEDWEVIHSSGLGE
jgi:steroid delta-isomerase-like uncharacterized protein